MKVVLWPRSGQQDPPSRLVDQEFVRADWSASARLQGCCQHASCRRAVEVLKHNRPQHVPLPPDVLGGRRPGLLCRLLLCLLPQRWRVLGNVLRCRLCGGKSGLTTQVNRPLHGLRSFVGCDGTTGLDRRLRNSAEAGMRPAGSQPCHRLCVDANWFRNSCRRTCWSACSCDSACCKDTARSSRPSTTWQAAPQLQVSQAATPSGASRMSSAALLSFG